jgi:hypothetical protein
MGSHAGGVPVATDIDIEEWAELADAPAPAVPKLDSPVWTLELLAELDDRSRRGWRLRPATGCRIAALTRPNGSGSRRCI